MASEKPTPKPTFAATAHEIDAKLEAGDGNADQADLDPSGANDCFRTDANAAKNIKGGKLRSLRIGSRLSALRRKLRSAQMWMPKTQVNLSKA